MNVISWHVDGHTSSCFVKSDKIDTLVRLSRDNTLNKMARLLKKIAPMRPALWSRSKDKLTKELYYGAGPEN